MRVEVKGLEHVDPSKAYVIMGNHVSMFDIPLVFGFMPVSFIGIEASEHFKTPLYGWALRRYGNIPINRRNSRESLQSILKGAESIKNGTSVVILPEGTRTTSPDMGNFKTFPFVLAQKSKHEILPFAFSGLWKINNKTSWHIHPGKITITFGEPVPAKTVTVMELSDLSKLVKNRISNLRIEP
jgi:1-acyl-sn-glycerol-3-phosphate acyltransferase